jgi:hypothetical protein
MRTVAVTARDGTEWAVRVVWQPRWPLLVRRFGGWRARRRTKKRGHNGEMVDVADPALSMWGDAVRIEGDLGDDIVVAILVIVGMIVFGLLFWFLLLPLLLLLFDVVVLLSVFALATIARVLFRRPWTVEAVPATKGKRARQRQVIGWRAALRTRDALAEHLRTGSPMDTVVQPG